MTQDFLVEKIRDEDNREKIAERIQYLDTAKKAILNIFKVMNLIHNSKIDFDNGLMKKHEVVNQQWDLEKIQSAYDERIRDLVDYIKKIRENLDFFDFSVDNSILKF